MKKSVKILFGVLILIAGLAIAGIAASWFAVSRSNPEYSGAIFLKGISSEVEIYRDKNGVPYIHAASKEDAAFALGFVHAQERMFQMDLIRRIASGNLSEIFGEKTIEIDKLFRTLKLKSVCDSNYNKLNPVSKLLLDAYSEGVNSYLKENRNNAGLEFDLLEYSPRDWKPRHSLLAAKMMSAILNINWWTDMAYSDLLHKLPEEMVRDIIAGYPENAPLVIPKQSAAEVNKSFLYADKLFRKYFQFDGTHLGSNNWVVNGKKSESGKPLIANDIHLALQLPGTWFAAVVNSPDWNSAGFTLPGLPGFVIGSNGRTAWAVTNVMTDDSDFYTEKIDSSVEKYLFDGVWRNLSITEDTIKVRNSEDIIFKIKETIHGPLINELHPYNYLYERNDSTAISLKWAAGDFSDELFAVYSVNTSNNFNEFKSALSHYYSPGQNFMYADSSGNIGYVCAARIPIRRNNSPTMIFDGVSSKYDWLGYVPYSKMPKIYNPPQNYLASANNKIDKNFKYHISNVWEPPSRIIRINRLMNSKEKFSVSDFKKFQMDIYSEYASEIVPFILNSFSQIRIKDGNLRTALKLLERWNFEMDRESQTPAIFLVFYQKLLENIFLDEMGKENFKEFLFIANIPYKTVVKLLNRKYSKWFDNRNTPVVENRDMIIRRSLSDALTELENKFGNNIAFWQWGRMHKIELKHPFSLKLPFLSFLFNAGPDEISGDGTTLNNTEYSFTQPYDVKVGASLRFIYDFGNPNVIEYILPAGESGHIFSAHYKDMYDKWLKGGYNKMYLSAESLNKDSVQKLILIPKEMKSED